MAKKSLHKFYLSLIPNLVAELFFFIPKNEIRDDIIEEFDFLQTHDILNTIFVFDYQFGPMKYIKTRNIQSILLKGDTLEKNIFLLLEKKSTVSQHEFNYVLNKYFEMVECLFYLTNWMNLNLNQAVGVDNGIKGIFHLQFTHFKDHFKVLVKHFYPTKEVIPKGNFNAEEIIKNYFPDITESFEKTNLSVLNKADKMSHEYQNSATKLTAIRNGAETNLIALKQEKKPPLITENEAKNELLRTIFNIK